MGTRWTETEIAYLRLNRATMSTRDMASALGRPKDATAVKLAALGIVAPPQRLWTELEDGYLTEHYASMTAQAMANALRRPLMATRTRIDTLGLGKIGWSDEQVALLRSLYGTHSVTEVAQVVGKGRSIVIAKANDLGLISRHHSGRASVRSDYFHVIDRPTKAYLLGFLAADGNVRDNYPTVTLSLNAKDREVIELARSEIAPLMRPFPDRSNGRLVFQISSRQLVDDLARYGIVPRKSLTIGWPTALPSNMERAFILGEFDGDGSIAFQKRGYPIWNIVGTQMLLSGIADAIERGCGVRVSGPAPMRARCYVIQTWGTKALTVDDWLHSDGLGLQRKVLRGNPRLLWHPRNTPLASR